jgi:hypothetical protein
VEAVAEPHHEGLLAGGGSTALTPGLPAHPPSCAWPVGSREPPTEGAACLRVTSSARWPRRVDGFARVRGRRWRTSPSRSARSPSRPATVAQGAVAALLGVGAFRGNIVALTALALAGGVRVVLLADTIARVIARASDAASPRLILELVVTTPVALLWIAGGVSALRTLRRGAVSGREHG